MSDRPSLEECFEGFEWDARKNVANVEKHGINFGEALKVFSDPDALIFESNRRAEEIRYLIVGRVDDMLLTVVFTFRGAGVRIISARRARKSERERYGQ
jgi:uncharacterized DUF497 family protein